MTSITLQGPPPTATGPLAASALQKVLAHADAVGHDIVVSVLEGLEKHRWMLHAQTT